MNFDSFSSGQYLSKIWLAQVVENILQAYANRPDGYRIWILAGWYGVTNLILRTRGILKIAQVQSFDQDPDCLPIAEAINETWVWQNWQFKSHTKDINHLTYDVAVDLVINTSIEHMHSDQWFQNIPAGMLVALQGSNLKHDDHTNAINSTKEMMERYPLSEFLYEGTKHFDYGDHCLQRFMIIGIK